MGVISVFPVVAVAWVLGMRAALAAALLFVPLDTLLLNLAGDQGWGVFFANGGGPGLAALLLSSAVVGRLHDLSAKLAEEVHERAQAQRAAEELAALRSDFVVSVSHELRTPLTAIIGYAELLHSRWEYIEDSKRRDQVAIILQAANRQKRLVEDLLLLRRLEGGAPVLRCQALLLAPLVQRAATEVKGIYGGQGITLEGSSEVAVLANPDRTLQVLANLLDNAAKYSPEGSPIVVSWVVQGSNAVVRVRDFGPGVPKQGGALLFTRFGRIPGSKIRAGHVGTGLGLYLGRQLAEAMGGDLELEETGPDGSTFRLRLPLAPDGAPPPSTPPAAA